MKSERKFLRLIPVIGLIAALTVTGCASKESGASQEEPKYPTKQMDLVVSFAAGGGNDLVGRAAADFLTKEWGQTVNVVNKPGAGGAAGVQESLKGSKNDGYTALVAGVTNSSALLAGNKSLSFKMEDFKWISKIAEDPYCFVVKADAEWNDLKEFSDWAKSNPDKITYSTPGPTGTATFAIAEWMDVIGADFSKARMITTTGGAESLPKIAGGHILVGAFPVSEVSTMVKSGKLKILAVHNDTRSQFFPDVPTSEELGIKGLTVKWWLGLSLPAGTPDYIVKKWDESAAKMVKDAAFNEKLKSLNCEVSYMNSADVSKLANDEAAKLLDVAEKKGLRK